MSQSKSIVGRPRQLSTPSTLQPPLNFVPWAVSRQFHQTVSHPLAAEDSAEVSGDLPVLTSTLSRSLTSTPNSSCSTSTCHDSPLASTPHSTSSNSIHHSSSSASTNHSSSPASTPHSRPLTSKSKRMGASQVCLSDVSTDESD